MTNAFRGVLTRTFRTEDVYDDQGELLERGSEKTYRFVLNYNAIAALEEVTGRGMLEILSRLNAGVITAGELRAIYYAISLKYQPDITIEEAGELIEVLPTLWTDVFGASLVENKGEASGKKPTRKTKTRS